MEAVEPETWVPFSPLSLSRNQVATAHLHNGVVARVEVRSRWAGYLSLGLSLLATRPRVVLVGLRTPANAAAKARLQKLCRGVDLEDRLVPLPRAL